MKASWIFLVLISTVMHPLRDLMLKRVCPSYFLLIRGVHKLGFDIKMVCCHHRTKFALNTTNLATCCIECNRDRDLFFRYSGSAVAWQSVSLLYDCAACTCGYLVVQFFGPRANYLLVTLVGISLIMIGGLMIQKTRGSLLNDPRAFGLAALAMLGYATYSISDATAM